MCYKDDQATGAWERGPLARISARFVVVNDDLREAIGQRMADLGLGVTSSEIDASTNTVRKILDPVPARVNIGTLAKLCISLEMTPVDAEELGLKALTREMSRRLKPDPFTDAVRRTLEP